VNELEPALLCFAFANRIALILAGLIGRVVARSEALGAHAHPLLLRLSRALARLQNVMGHLAQGHPVPAARSRKGVPGGPRPAHRLPSHRGWLLEALGAEAAEYRERLEHLLAKPDVALLIQAAPNMLRHLRPLCRMLGLPDPLPGAPSNRIPTTPRPMPEREAKPVWDYHPSAHPWGHPEPPYVGIPV
jgi:hypothetical protein